MKQLIKQAKQNYKHNETPLIQGETDGLSIHVIQIDDNMMVFRMIMDGKVIVNWTVLDKELW